MLFKWHNTLPNPFHFTRIRLLNVTVPLAITYLLKQDRTLIPFWFKIYMHSPQSGLHDIEKLLHAHLPTWQETKTFYISDISWPDMVLEDNCSLQRHIAIKKLNLKIELNLWMWFANSNICSLLCHLSKYKKMKAVGLLHILKISMEIFRFKFFFHIFSYEKVTEQLNIIHCGR